MKIFTGLFIVTLLVLLISAGCTSSEKSTGMESPILNDASTVFTENSLTNTPADTTAEQDMRSLIVGDWKIQTGDQQILYWQFHDDGNLTGGSEPSGHQITGDWSIFGFENLITINAAGTNSNGDLITYDMELTTDLTNGTISVVNPDEDTNWQFIRQPILFYSPIHP